MYKTLNPLLISQYIYESGLTIYSQPVFIAYTFDFDFNGKSINTLYINNRTIGYSKQNFITPLNIPNDEYFNKQWYLHNTGQLLNDGHYGTVDADIDALEAWNITMGNQNIVVAVIDHGVTSNHSDLPNSRQLRLPGSNFRYNLYSSPPYNNPDDPSPYLINSAEYHGNACAGIIAAENNDEGIIGIAPHVKIMPIRKPGTTDFDILAETITFAVDNGADVISASWGTQSSNPYYNATMVDAIADAIQNNIPVIFAAGNYADQIGYFNIHHPGTPNLGFVAFPACAPEVIAVGASDRDNQQANYSPTSERLDIVAPSSSFVRDYPNDGHNVWALDLPDIHGLNPSYNEILPDTGINYLNYTGRFGGTSATAPQVAGVIALIKSVNDCLSVNQIKNIIYQTADKVGGYNYNWDLNNPGHSKELGYGRVNAYAAVQLAQQMNSSTLDLYVKDRPDDMGVEPNPTPDNMWISEDIWIRNIDDGGLTHQNPEYNSNGDPNYIYVRVINKSCVASNGTETLTINWAKANTALAWPQNWDGSLTNSGGYPLGDELAPVTIPVIQPGAEAIVKIPWVVPNPDNYTTGAGHQDPWHFCLLARIDDGNPVTMTTNPNTMVRNNNNLAWKNIHVVDLVNETTTTATVMVANPFNSSKTYYLELIKDEKETGKAVYEEAEVTLKMDDVLFNAWERGGKIAQEVEDKNDEKEKLVKGNDVLLDNIAFNPNERGLLTLDFKFLTEEITDKDKFVYHVIQRDATTGEIIGGETFLIRKKQRPLFVANAGDDKEVDLNDPITITAEDINEIAEYNWYDSEGNLVYQGKDLTVSADVTKKYKLEVVTPDGFKDYDEVEVKLRDGYIETISPNPASNTISISYKLNGASSAYLMIVNLNNNSSNNYLLETDTDSKTIDVSNYPNGNYALMLICNGNLSDIKNLIKN